MKNFQQDGSVLPVTAPYDVQRGSGVLIGQLFGIATATVKAGTSVDIMCKGEYTVDKVSAETWAVGDKIYWNGTSKKFTTVASGGLLVGLASEIAVNPTLLGSLLLTQQPGMVDFMVNPLTGKGRLAGGAGLSENDLLYPIATLGDSIVQQGTNYIGGANKLNRGIVPWMLSYLGQPWGYQPSDNFAVSGTTLDAQLTSQLPALQAAVAAGRYYKKVFVSAGTNDTNSGRTLTEIKAGYLTLFAAIRSLGAMPVMWGILPRGVDVAVTDSKRANMHLNDWLYVQSSVGLLEYIDCTDCIADNTTAFGNLIAASAYDGVLHPNAKGCALIGKQLADYYSLRGVKPGMRFAQQQSDSFNRTYNPSGVAFANANPLLQGGTTAPTGMTTSGGTWSKVTRALSNGVNRTDCQCVLAAATNHYLYDDWGATGAWTASDLQPGDIIEARALVEIASGVNISSVNLQLSENDGTTAFGVYDLGQMDAVIPDGNHTLYLRTPLLTVRPYSGSGNASIFARVNIVVAAAGSGTATVRAFEVRKVA